MIDRNDRRDAIERIPTDVQASDRSVSFFGDEVVIGLGAYLAYLAVITTLYAVLYLILGA